MWSRRALTCAMLSPSTPKVMNLRLVRPLLPLASCWRSIWNTQHAHRQSRLSGTECGCSFKLGTVRCHVHKGQLKLDGAVEKVEERTPFLKNRSAVLRLGQLIIDVLILDRPGIIVCFSPGRCHPQTSAAWGWTAGRFGAQQALRSACASAQTAACCAYRSFSKTESWVMPPFIKIA